MPYTTVVAGTTITASWGNANVRDQVVTPFASASARDSAITAPVEGMLSYLQDVDLFTYYDGSSWITVPKSVYVRKTVDEAVANSTTLQNDDVLSWPLAANGVYALDMRVQYSADSAGDLKYGWSVPAGAAMRFGHWGVYDTAGSFTSNAQYTESSTPAVGGVGSGTAIMLAIAGIVTVSSTAGTLQWKWAQNASAATGTTVFQGSYGVLTRIA